MMPMPRPRRVSSSNEDVSIMALSIFDKVREIKKKYTAQSRHIDRFEREIRERLESIRTQVNKIADKRDRDLVTILVINGLHRTADEVLIDR